MDSRSAQRSIWHAAAAGEKGQRYADAGADPKLTEADGQASAGGLQPSTRARARTRADAAAGGCSRGRSSLQLSTRSHPCGYSKRPRVPSAGHGLARGSMPEGAAAAVKPGVCSQPSKCPKRPRQPAAEQVLAARRVPQEARGSRARARTRVGCPKRQQEPSSRAYARGRCHIRARARSREGPRSRARPRRR